MAQSSNRTSNNGKFIDLIPKYTPPRRGYVPTDGNFDFLMHLCVKAPKPKDEDLPKNKRKRGEKKGKGKAKEKRPEPAVNCTSSKKRPGGGIAAPGNGGEGSSRDAAMGEGGIAGGAESTGIGGTLGDGSTGGDGTLGGGPSDGIGNMGSVGGSAAGESGENKPYKITKRVNRRSRTGPKRTYTWRDPVKKNKTGKRDGTGKGKDRKGKGKEM
jgi:hypothetical protein